MSETKFTKGEWRVQITEVSYGKEVLEVVTDWFGVCCHKLGIRNEHDANLIAAAPEMYAELQDLVSDYECSCRYESCRVCNQRESIINLLAKARGEK